MRKTIEYAPPYSLAFVTDANGGKAQHPSLRRGQEFVVTPSCISFGVLMSQDGPTAFTIGDFRKVMPQRVPQEAPAFDGWLETPTERIIVSSAERETFLEMPVRTKKTRVRIWTNHPTEPDEVIIGVE